MSSILAKLHCGYRALLEALCQRMDRALLKSPCFRGRAVFGPVRTPAGYELGINTMKCKLCTYDCIYCQTGQTTCRSTCRESCIGAYELHCVVRKKLELLEVQRIPVDSITFAPQGEPTLDDNLAQKIRLLREFGRPIAVVTNASLLWNERLQEDLLLADRVQLKVDTLREETWRRLNRPHSRLRFPVLLDGIRSFAKRYRGVLTTETMLVRGVNDSIEELEAIAAFLDNFPRKASRFTIPTRPPAERRTRPPELDTLARLAEFLRQRLPGAELQFSAPEDSFHGAGRPEDELLATLAAQPMSEPSVREFMAGKPEGLDRLEELLAKGEILLTTFEERPYCILAPMPS